MKKLNKEIINLSNKLGINLIGFCKLEYFKDLEDNYSPTNFEFDYWRKCYNLRSRFLEVFNEHKGWSEDHYEITLQITDLYDYIEKGNSPVSF